MSPLDKVDTHSYKSMKPLRDPGAYVKHPERGPDVFMGAQTTKQEEAPRELVCRIDNNFN
jgi:hypothetical protein